MRVLLLALVAAVDAEWVRAMVHPSLPATCSNARVTSIFGAGTRMPSTYAECAAATTVLLPGEEPQPPTPLDPAAPLCFFSDCRRIYWNPGGSNASTWSQDVFAICWATNPPPFEIPPYDCTGEPPPPTPPPPASTPPPGQHCLCGIHEFATAREMPGNGWEGRRCDQTELNWACGSSLSADQESGRDWLASHCCETPAPIPPPSSERVRAFPYAVIPLLLISPCVTVALCYCKIKARQRHREHQQQMAMNQAAGVQMGGQIDPSLPVAQAQLMPVAPMQQMAVQCPPGKKPGDSMLIATPSGQQMMVQVPAGVTPGGTFMMQVPAQPAMPVAQAVPMTLGQPVVAVATAVPM